MKQTLLAAVLLALALTAEASTYWTSAPATVQSGEAYTMTVEASGEQDAQVWLYKNGAFVAHAQGWYSVSASHQSTDFGAQSIGYTADAIFSFWNGVEYVDYWEGASHTVQVLPANAAPTIAWTQAPAGAQVNQWFNIEARGNDADGNLANVYVWREWVPHAFAPGGNGYEGFSGNPSYGPSSGTVTFMAQARDSSDAYSPVIYHTVAISNSAPGVEWLVNPASANVNQYFTMQARGSDPNGNLSWVRVWREGEPFAFNGGGNGSWSDSDNNGASLPYPGTVGFTTQSGDSEGAVSGVLGHTVTIINRTPHNPTISASGTGVQWNATHQHYTMWLEETGNAAKPGTITLTGNVKDADGNLNLHRIWKGPGGTTDWANPITSITPANPADSTATHADFKPPYSGRWDFHTNAQDTGGAWSAGASLTVWVYGPTNHAEVVSFKVNGVSYPPATASIPVTLNNHGAIPIEVVMRNGGASASKPWTSDGTPHRLGLVGDDNRWGATRHALAAEPVSPFPTPGQTVTFTFQLTAPAIPLVNQVVRWQMVEDFIQWFGQQTPALVVTVVDSIAPSTPTNLSAPAATPTTVQLAWTASTDNGAVSHYEVEREHGTTLTSTAPSFVASDLAPDTAYRFRVRARDGAGNLSTWTDWLTATTALDPAADSDGDGLPNGWESANGLNPRTHDALLDLDGDGLSNFAEYNLGTAANVRNFGSSTLGGSIPAGWPNADANATVAVGATTGTLSVDPSGAATYTIPLWTTPGTAGMQPQVSLNYSSQAGPGLAGFGWSLGGVSAITRGPQTRIIDGANRGVTLTAADRFYLDGQRLIVLSGSYGAAGSEYRTELDSITKVVAHGSAGSGPASFTAWTKSGLVIQFGQTADSAFNAWGRAEKVSWHVNRISDTKGNYMDFVYVEDAAAGVHRLDRINYTGNGSVAPFASLRFEYEDRPDWIRGYLAGSPVSSQHRLRTVKSCYGETVARTYTLTYDQRPVTARSLLASITEAGSDGKAYAPLTFAYEDNDAGWEDIGAFTPPYYLADNANGGRPAGSGFIDFNGDGFVDFVARREGAGINLAKRNTGSGWADEISYLLPYELASSGSPDDRGSRFVDLNGDGLVDYVWSWMGAGGAPTASGAYLNTGTGWAAAPQWTPPAPIAKDSEGLRTGRFLDVNADGRPDYVAMLTPGGGNTVQLSVYLNNGNGWDAAHPGYSTMSDNLALARARFLDLNGDGLVDIAAYYHGSGTTIRTSHLNTGSGWTYSSAYLLPQLIADNVNFGLGAEFNDVNGDGLTDLVWYREYGAGHQRGVALNTGAGWQVCREATVAVIPGEPLDPLDPAEQDGFNRYAPPSPLSRDSLRSSGSALMDLNLDGLADSVLHRQFSNGPVFKAVHYGTARDWAYTGAGHPHEGLPPLLLQPGVEQTGVDFVDVDGDGAVDVVWNRRHADGASTFQGAWRNKAKPSADRLKSVTNGFGVTAEVTYGSLLDPEVYAKAANNDDLPEADRAKVANLIGPMRVVTRLRNDNGAGGFHDLVYSYASLRSHLERGSLGFGYLKVRDTATDVRTQTWLRQDYPFIGQPDYVKVTRGSDSGPLLSESDTTWAEKPLHSASPYPTRLLYAATVEEKAYDLTTGALTLTTTTTTAVPDDFGNVTSMTVSTSDGFTKVTTSTYEAPDTVNWILGRLATASVVSSAPGVPSITRASSFTYQPGSGLLRTETVEPGDPVFALTTTYGYDSFGNRTSVTVSGPAVTVDANGAYTAAGSVSRTTTTQYDGQGRFPVWTRNALDHQENYTGYNLVLGVLTQLTGANGLSTDWVYDGFGRKVLEVRADGTSSTTAYRWSDFAARAWFVETESSGAAPALARYDRYGRLVRTLTISGDGRLVQQDTGYDAFSRPNHRTNPSYNDGSPVYATTTAYDLLGRPKSTVTPDDQNGPQTTTYDYNGFSATATDPKGRVSATVRNSQGWITSSIRNQSAGLGAADYSAVTSAYDALGNLTATTAAGVITTLDYDLRGRKTAMTDPDMGTWQYRYNCFGELIWQKDAKGQITTLAYDALGRLVSRSEPEGATTWTYDTSPTKGLGKLHTVSGPGGCAETHLYDSLGRPSESTRTPDAGSGAFTVGTEYDSSGRPHKLTYPTGVVAGQRLAVRQVYNAFGYLKEIRHWLDADTGRPNAELEGRLYWQADQFGPAGRIEGETYGNGLANDRVHSPATGRLVSARIDRGANLAGPFLVQHLDYTYDAVGNVVRRNDQTSGFERDEFFYAATPGDGYDGLDRLKVHRIGGGATVTVAYDQRGNITAKSDVGSYAYGHTPAGRSNVLPHAVSGAGVHSYTYDANGNMLTGAGRTQEWSSFNQLRKVTSGGLSSEFSFGAGRERVKQVRRSGATVTDVTYYVGALYEKVVASATGRVEHKHYILAPTGRVAVLTQSTLHGVLQANTTRYLHTDGLGSITVVSDEQGAVLKRYAYDAWGKQATTYTRTAPGITNQAPTTRGYTDHEMLAEHGLIHMNGRVYDPVLGRFLSADPFVDDAGDSQSYNRYSYVSNNPLGYTDPSGYIKLSFKTILKIVAVVAIAYFTAGAAISAWGTTMTTSGSFAAGTATVTVTAGSTFATMMPVAIGNGIIGGLAGGFASGFAGSLLNGGSIGDAFKAGVIGGVAGAVGGGIAGAFSDAGLLTRTVAASAVGGATSEAMGGSFRDGALIAGAVTLANFGWQKAKEFTDETAYKAARTAEASGTDEGKRLAQELRVTDPTGNPRTDGKIPSVKGNEWGPKWLNRLLSPLDRRLENTGMARQGSDGHGYDRAKWTGGQDGWVSRNINDVSKLHDWFNGWSYDSVTGYHVTHGPLFNTAFAAYSFGGMVPAWALTNVALTNPSVSIQAYNQDRRRP